MAEYAPETKAAVMAALLAGQSVSSVAREYKIPKGTVSDWKRKAHELAEHDGKTAYEARQESIADLLLVYLTESLRALTAQVRHFGDPEWLRRQEAQQLAVLHGVQTDKAIRLLEALSGGEEPEE